MPVVSLGVEPGWQVLAAVRRFVLGPDLLDTFGDGGFDPQSLMHVRGEGRRGDVETDPQLTVLDGLQLRSVESVDEQAGAPGRGAVLYDGSGKGFVHSNQLMSRNVWEFGGGKFNQLAGGGAFSTKVENMWAKVKFIVENDSQNFDLLD